MEFIKNLNLKYADKNEYEAIALKADIKSSLNGNKIKKDIFKKTNKELVKKDYYSIKSSYTKSKLALIKLKENSKIEFDVLKRNFLKEKQILLDSKKSIFIKNSIKVLNEKLEQEKSLAYFSIDDKLKLSQTLDDLEQIYKQKREELNKYESKVDIDKKIYSLENDLKSQIQKNKTTLKSKLNYQKKKLKLERNIFLSKLVKYRIKNFWLKRKTYAELWKEKHCLISEARISQKNLLKKKIYLNAFFEPIIEEKISQNKVKKLRKISSRRSFLKKFKNEPFKEQKAKIEYIKAKLSVYQKMSDNSFNSKLKILEYSVKLEHEIKVLSILENYKSQIEYAKKELANTPKKSPEIVLQIQKQKIIAKNNYIKEIMRIKKDYSMGKFSKSSKKNSIISAKKQLKFERNSACLINQYLIASEKLKFLYIDKKRQIEKEYKIMNSTIDDAQKNIPTKMPKYQKWIAMLFSFLLPGLGQLLNRQYVKGAIILAISVFMWAFLIPLTFGWIGSSEGDGVFGLGILSPNVGGIILGDIFLDARFRLIEGIIAIMTLSVSLVIILTTMRDAYITGKWLSQGIRSKNSRHLRNYLANNGSPLIILTPAFVLIALIVILPLMATILLAFTDYGIRIGIPGITNPLNWVGFSNFDRIFTGDFGPSIAFVTSWTIIWTVSVSLGVIFIGTLLAIIVDNKRIKGKIIWSTIYVLPWAIPAFATILFFSIAFGNGTSGIYNQIFGTTIDFQGS
ncbi:sugar ABC transporter permease [[Mycoplasma] mobile]|uniref:Maltodextrin ABC transporter permease protein n=1 Tax=Mycoplasma mobile (strain ATCC 43663 / 163K / NCTC 11711) TaxID=267748 RepID=Q6KHQ3_MYCM1|nr:maltodextrin ABC transporter permease [[Mycoplasma] mobile]AAT27875.1 maltodextrin ABC transporter permease protein [Mycoplasma mobile 163K]